MTNAHAHTVAVFAVKAFWLIVRSCFCCRISEQTPNIVVFQSSQVKGNVANRPSVLSSWTGTLFPRDTAALTDSCHTLLCHNQDEQVHLSLSPQWPAQSHTPVPPTQASDTHSWLVWCLMPYCLVLTLGLIPCFWPCLLSPSPITVWPNLCLLPISLFAANLAVKLSHLGCLCAATGSTLNLLQLVIAKTSEAKWENMLPRTLKLQTWWIHVGSL